MSYSKKDQLQKVKIKRKAKNNRKALKLKLDKAVIQIIRERDKWTCQHCGKPVEKSNAHVSHVIPRSHGDNLRWDLLNLKLLCFHCHINWWHKNPIEAYEWFKGKFPERYDYLMVKKEEVIKFKELDLEELLEKIKAMEWGEINPHEVKEMKADLEKSMDW